MSVNKLFHYISMYSVVSFRLFTMIAIWLEQTITFTTHFFIPPTAFHNQLTYDLIDEPIVTSYTSTLKLSSVGVKQDDRISRKGVKRKQRVHQQSAILSKRKTKHEKKILV